MSEEQDYKVQDLIYINILIAYLIALFFVIKNVIKLMILSFKGYKVTLKDYAKIIAITLEELGFNWVYVLVFNIAHIIAGIMILITPMNVLIEIVSLIIVAGFIFMYVLALGYSWSLAIKSFRENREG